MNDHIPAPTLRVNVGDTLRIRGRQPFAAQSPQQRTGAPVALPQQRESPYAWLARHAGAGRSRCLRRLRGGRHATWYPAWTRTTARVSNRPRSPARRVLVSPAFARNDRDPGRQRHGGRADHQRGSRPGSRNRRRRGTRVRLSVADYRCRWHARVVHTGCRQPRDRRAVSGQWCASTAHRDAAVARFRTGTSSMLPFSISSI